MTTANGGLVARLREACDGHPHAKIEWPHRILHEAADEIERLQADKAELLAALKFVANGQDATVHSFAKRAVYTARNAIEKAEARK